MVMIHNMPDGIQPHTSDGGIRDIRAEVHTLPICYLMLVPRTDLFPVPTRYVLVPCRVINPGFCPSTRTTRELSCWTFGRLSSTMEAIRETILFAHGLRVNLESDWK